MPFMRSFPSLSRRWLRFFVPSALLFAVLGGAALALTESDTVKSFWDGLWWSLSLVTTVGFVGRAPTTDVGKIVSAFLMVTGFLLITMTTAAIASLFVREDEIPEDRRELAFQEEVRDELRLLRSEVADLRRRLGAHAD
jgi:voltage-gated potassium channel